MSLILSNDINDNFENKDPDNLMKWGIDTIYQSFNSNILNYQEEIKKQKKIINDLKKKLEIMKEEMEMIQRENQYYKNQNEKLKAEIENLNKVVSGIKGKLTKFDFNINNNRIMNNINEENLYDNNQLINKNEKRRNNKIIKDIYTINNPKYEINSYHRDNQSLKNLEFNKNSRTLKYGIKNYELEDINESDINNLDNNIDLEQEININNFQKNFNVDNNIYKNKNEQLNIYNNSRSKKKAHNDYNNIIFNSNFHNNTLNSKIKNNNYNNEKIKLKKYENNSFVISSILNSENKNNINFNKNEIMAQKKINKNKIRSNSSNNVIQRKNDNQEIKNLTTRNKVNENNLPIFNELQFEQNIDKIDYKRQICQTYESQKNQQKNINNNINGNMNIKDSKIKEMSLFLKKCKIYLDQSTFDKIVKIFQDYKNGIINDDIFMEKIKKYLKNNNELLVLFKNIFS